MVQGRKRIEKKNSLNSFPLIFKIESKKLKDLYFYDFIYSYFNILDTCLEKVKRIKKGIFFKKKSYDIGDGMLLYNESYVQRNIY